MNSSVFITRKIPETGIDLLRKHCRVHVQEGNRPADSRQLEEAIRQSDALVTTLSDNIDEKLLDKAEKLKIIANYAVGYNNIDVSAALARNIMVTHTPGVLTNATAELAFALIIALTRRIKQAERFTRQGSFEGWDPMLFLGDELWGKTLGVIGMGRIGRNLAEKCRAFGMEVVYHNRNRLDPETEKALSAEYRTLDQLLAESDVISVHAPLTDHTRHLLDRQTLAKIKAGAYLINTARGEIIDEEALADAIADGAIKGAGLDVYENEPQINTKLFDLDNVILLPHIGSATAGTREAMSVMVAKNVISALEGSIPENLVPEMAEKMRR